MHKAESPFFKLKYFVFHVSYFMFCNIFSFVDPKRKNYANTKYFKQL